MTVFGRVGEGSRMKGQLVLHVIPCGTSFGTGSDDGWPVTKEPCIPSTPSTPLMPLQQAYVFLCESPECCTHLGRSVVPCEALNH